MKILISGAGIAGLTLAFALSRERHEITIAEKSPALRDEGYMIDFFGSGFDVAERLGLMPELERIHHSISRLSFLDARGREKFDIPYSTVRRLFDGRHFNLLRGELERVLYSRVRDSIEIRFGVTIASIREAANSVDVEFSDGSAGTVDLVVGADGIHSQIRRLVFGPERDFTRYLGYHAAAAIVAGPLPTPDPPDAFCTITSPGRQVGVYPMPGGKIAAFFIHGSRIRVERFSFEPALQELRNVYGGLEGFVPELLTRIDRSSFSFDEVSQIEMPAWSSGRVTLVGDACQCVSLLAGQGASLAMAGAYVLAEEIALGRSDLSETLGAYERRMRPGIERRQSAGRRIARWFVPEGRFGVALQDFVTRIATWPVVWRLVRASMAPESILRP